MNRNHTEPTPRELLFIDYFFDPKSDSFDNFAKSAAKAHYSESYALRFAQFVQKRKWFIKYKEKLGDLVTAEEVIQGIKDEWKGGKRAPDRLKALEMLGKNKKLFTDKVETLSSESVVFKIESDESTDEGSKDKAAPKAS